VELHLSVGVELRRREIYKHVGIKDLVMELNLQFGYGMMDHCRTLLTQWGGGTAILSPRDLNDDQLHRLAHQINEITNARVLLDPQFYLPNADHERLRSHRYWPHDYQTGTFWGGGGIQQLVANVAQLNAELQSDQMLLPGMLAHAIDETWLATQSEAINAAQQLNTTQFLIATVALSGDALRNPDQVAELIEASEDWDIDGVYLVCEHPSAGYFVEEPLWLAHVMDIIAAFRLRGKSVILGYSNQQLLIAACAKVDAISSGTWMNVRAFPQAKFRTSYEEEIRQRAIWYYCPHAMSEFKIPFLDVAYSQRMLEVLRPRMESSDASAALLFSGVLPSSIGFTEQASFRHYLSCLRAQVSRCSGASFDETVEIHERLLDEAADTLARLRRAGVLGQVRDFGQIVDVNRAALELFRSTRGPMMRRRWDAI
jgi:hypothetical protein